MDKVLDAIEKIAVALFIVFVAGIIVIGQFPPCEWEDQTMCIWDSAAHGNAKGSSFIAFLDDFRIYFL